MAELTLFDIALIPWYIIVLVFLEGVLSADNALVLALMVRHLPKREQRRVLQYGIWGAVGFRIVAVGLSAFLLKFWYFKVIGGAYLLFLAIKHFVRGEAGPESGTGGWDRTFWGTVTSITITDIVFSLDSILAAVALADDFPKEFGYIGKLCIVIIGGILGIITMRLVVRSFVTLLDHFPGLAQGAYALVAWIGLKLVLSGLYSAKYIGFQINEWLFWSVMLAIAVLSFVIQPRQRPAETIPGIDELLDEEEESVADEGGDGTKRPDPDHEMRGASDGRGDLPNGRPTPAEGCPAPEEPPQLSS
jgi:YkoY family integral membrane protein